MIKRPSTVVATASTRLLAACAAAPAPAAGPQDADVVIVADDLAYTPQRIEIAAGEHLRLHLRNEGAIAPRPRVQRRLKERSGAAGRRHHRRARFADGVQRRVVLGPGSSLTDSPTSPDR